MMPGKCPLLLQCLKALSRIGRGEKQSQEDSEIGKVCSVCFVPEFYGYSKPWRPA